MEGYEVTTMENAISRGTSPFLSPPSPPFFLFLPPLIRQLVLSSPPLDGTNHFESAASDSLSFTSFSHSIPHSFLIPTATTSLLASTSR